MVFWQCPRQRSSGTATTHAVPLLVFSFSLTHVFLTLSSSLSTFSPCAGTTTTRAFTLSPSAVYASCASSTCDVARTTITHTLPPSSSSLNELLPPTASPSSSFLACTSLTLYWRCRALAFLQTLVLMPACLSVGRNKNGERRGRQIAVILMRYKRTH